MPLNIQAVLQPQRSKVVLCELSRHEARGLIPKLYDALVYQPLIDFVVYIHA
jgi:hypothetical protein